MAVLVATPHIAAARQLTVNAIIEYPTGYVLPSGKVAVYVALPPFFDDIAKKVSRAGPGRFKAVLSFDDSRLEPAGRYYLDIRVETLGGELLLANEVIGVTRDTYRDGLVLSVFEPQPRRPEPRLGNEESGDQLPKTLFQWDP